MSIYWLQNRQCYWVSKWDIDFKTDSMTSEQLDTFLKDSGFQGGFLHLYTLPCFDYDLKASVTARRWTQRLNKPVISISIATVLLPRMLSHFILLCRSPLASWGHRLHLHTFLGWVLLSLLHIPCSMGQNWHCYIS